MRSLLITAPLLFLLSTTACSAFKPDHPQVYQSFKNRKEPIENQMAINGDFAPDAKIKKVKAQNTYTMPSQSQASVSNKPMTSQQTAGTSETQQQSDTLFGRIGSFFSSNEGSVATQEAQQQSEQQQYIYEDENDGQGSSVGYSYYDLAEEISPRKQTFISYRDTFNYNTMVAPSTPATAPKAPALTPPDIVTDTPIAPVKPDNPIVPPSAPKSPAAPQALPEPKIQAPIMPPLPVESIKPAVPSNTAPAPQIQPNPPVVPAPMVPAAPQLPPVIKDQAASQAHAPETPAQAIAPKHPEGMKPVNVPPPAYPTPPVMKPATAPKPLENIPNIPEREELKAKSENLPARNLNEIPQVPSSLDKQVKPINPTEEITNKAAHKVTTTKAPKQTSARKVVKTSPMNPTKFSSDDIKDPHARLTADKQGNLKVMGSLESRLNERLNKETSNENPEE